MCNKNDKKNDKAAAASNSSSAADDARLAADRDWTDKPPAPGDMWA